MIPIIQHKLTNWVDGMKIQKEHFVNSENAMLDAVRDTSAQYLTNFNFGLLYPAPGDKKSLDITILRSQSDNFKISVSLCRAVTAGGSRIEIMPQYDEEIVCEDKIESIANSGSKGKNTHTSYFAVITVDYFNRVPTGNPSPDEAPPRNPFSKPRYELHLIAEEDAAPGNFSAFHFPVAKFKFKAKELALDDTYIPPCAVIQAYPSMIQLYKNVGGSLNKLQEYSTEIVQKVIGKSQNSVLAQNIKKLSENNARYISSIFFKLRLVLTQLPPVFLAEVASQLANEIKLTFDFMPEKEKEEMLTYFKEWNQISPAAFSELLGEVIDLEYDHNNIYESFVPVINLLARLTELFEKLSQLDLIGKRQQKDIFVREMNVDDGKPVKKKGFNLLD